MKAKNETITNDLIIDTPRPITPDDERNEKTAYDANGRELAVGDLVRHTGDDGHGVREWRILAFLNGSQIETIRSDVDENSDDAYRYKEHWFHSDVELVTQWGRLEMIDHKTSTRHIVFYHNDDRDDAEKHYEKIVRKNADSHKLITADHAEIWFQDHVILDTTKEGSEQYIWDKTGNRVKHRRYRVKKTAGSIGKTALGFVYKTI